MKGVCPRMHEERELFQELADARKQGNSVALVTVVATHKSSPRKAGAKMLVSPDGTITGTIGGGILEAVVTEEAVKALARGESLKVAYSMDPENPESLKMCCGGEMELFIDVISRQSPLLIFGGGHVGEKIAQMAGVAGFSYIIVDDREEFANRDRFPGAVSVFAGPYQKAFTSLTIDTDTYIVICTRGHAYDLLCLREALKTDAAYIGVIASKKKATGFLNRIREEGLPADDPRIFSPVGLDLGDSSPGQIAVSVMAEIVKLKSGGSGAHKRLGN